MHSNPNRNPDDIVITGYGAITPIGHDVEKLHEALMLGKSGVGPLTTAELANGQRWFGAVIRDFDPKQHVQPRKIIKVMCREIQLGFGASMQACRMAGISSGTIAPDRLGTVFSGEIIFSEIGDVDSVVRMCIDDGEMNFGKWAPISMENLYPLWMLKSLPNMAACHVGIALDARGPNNTITTEGTSGLNAILEAINVIRRNKADVMIVGSTASRVTFTRLLQRYESDYSRNYVDGSSACKPFDSNRDGTVPGEVATAVVLERRSTAEARQASILGTIRSYANNFAPAENRWCGVHRSTELAIQSLMKRAKCDPSEVDHINAAANGGIRSDAEEAQGIAATLPNVPVVSYKGALGDSISGSGLVEWIASLTGMKAGSIAPTTNHKATAADCPIHVISKSAKNRSASSFIKLSNTPFGHCVGLLTEVE